MKTISRIINCFVIGSKKSACVSKLKVAILFFVALLCTIPTLSSALTLTTASKQGNYYSVGSKIKQILKRNNDIDIDVIASEGSIDNIKRLANNNATMAIIQSDILYRITTAKDDRLYKSYNSVTKEFRSLIALYPEYIQIIVSANNHNITNIYKLSGKKLYLGEDGSGSYENAIDILSSAGINPTDYIRQKVKGKMHEAEKLLESGEIDAIITTKGELSKNSRFKVLALGKDTVDRITNVKPYYSYEEAPLPSSQQKYILFTRAVLVARRDIANTDKPGLTHDAAYRMTKALHENWYDFQKYTNAELNFFSQDMIARKVFLPLHSGADKYFTEAGILASLGASFITLSAALSLVVLIIIINQWGMGWRWVMWLLDRRIIKTIYHIPLNRRIWDLMLKITTASGWIIALWIFLFIVAADISIIIYSEKYFAHNYDVENPFAGKSIGEIVFWLLTFAVTGFNQNIFPNSQLAKTSAVIIPVLAVLGAFILVVHQSIQRDRRVERQARGEIVPSLKDHILICGWNDRAANIINNLTSTFAPKSYNILILADIDHEKPIEKYEFDSRKVFYFKGMSSSYANLQAASIESAHSAIVMAGNKKTLNGNYRSIFTVSALRDTTACHSDDFQIIAELFYPNNANYFIDNKVNKLICLKDYSLRMLLHATINPGVSDILLNILSFNPPHKVALVRANDYGIHDISHGNALAKLRKKGILLLAAYKQTRAKQHNAIELDFDKNDSPYVVIPTKNSNDSTIAEDDKLIILSTGKPVSGQHSNNVQKIHHKPVEIKAENILIIGNHVIADELSEQIYGLAKSVFHIVTNDDYRNNLSIESSEDSNVRTIIEQDLQAALGSKDFDLNEITRIILIAPMRNPMRNQAEVYQDDETLQSITILKTYYKQNTMPHVMAEIRSLENLRLFHNAGIDQIVPTNKLIELSISRMVFHKGIVTEFFVKSMSYMDNDLVRIEKWSAEKLNTKSGLDLLGENYDSILEQCFLLGIKLIAIEKNINGSKTVIINPAINSQEFNEGLAINDSVFVFRSLIIHPNSTQSRVG